MERLINMTCRRPLPIKQEKPQIHLQYFQTKKTFNKNEKHSE